MARQRPDLQSLLLTAAVLLVIPSASASATAKPGITVSPAQLNFTLGEKATEQTIPITITNSYDTGVQLVASFEGIDEDAGLLIPTSNIDQAFASNLHISQTDVQLAANSTLELDVQVTNGSSLSSGGHYATLVLTQQSSGPSSIKAAISLSIFAIKTQGAHQSIAIGSLSHNGWLFGLPSDYSIDFKNTGNVQVVPRGVISIMTGSDVLLAKGIVNQQSLPLLPGESLKTVTPVIGIAHSWLPHKLKLSVAYRADGATDATIINSSMWYIPPTLLLLLIPLAALIRWWSYVHRFVLRLLKLFRSVRYLLRRKSKQRPATVELPPQHVVITSSDGSPQVITPKASREAVSRIIVKRRAEAAPRTVSKIKSKPARKTTKKSTRKSKKPRHTPKILRKNESA